MPKNRAVRYTNHHTPEAMTYERARPALALARHALSQDSSSCAEALLGVVPRLDLRLGHRVQQHAIRARVVVLRPLGPVVRDGVRVDVPLAVEGAARDGGRLLVERLEALARVLVPKVERALGVEEEGRVRLVTAASPCPEGWEVPSEPVVAKVPKVGWKAMQLTE